MEKTWPTMEGGRRRPTAEELISKLKDDGDFDNLRLMIIRKIKENEELRSNIVTEVKQSAIFNEEGSENLGPKQLSDAVYQELGKKIMGQISDELWKVIRTNENVKTDIRGTVESVYNRILNPNMKKEDHHASPSKENSVNGKEKSVSPLKASTVQADESELGEPPGFVQADQVSGNDHKVESEEREEGQNQHVPTEEVSRGPPNPVDVDDDDDDDNDMPPPGFGTSCLGNGAPVMSLDVIPPGFSVSGGGGADDDDDDPDVPPGFG